MRNQWLIISSHKGRQSLLADFLSQAKHGGRSFLLIATAKRLRRRARHEHWALKRWRMFASSPWLFSLLYPILWICSAPRLLILLWQQKPAAVILVNWPEKILFSAVAQSRSRLVWIDYPEQEQKKLPFIARRLYERASRRARIICFNPKRSEDNKANISVIKPASSGSIVRQDSIFKNLANQSERGRFVIGSVLYGLPKDQAERLLAALSIAQSVCPIIELVIIGEGKNRREIQWIARRMNLERKVWLGGPASDFGKWLSHLDTYVIANTKPTLEDASWAIAAMEAGLPVLGPQAEWLNSFVSPKSGALLDIDDAETLARQLIKLQQEEDMRHAFGKEAKKEAAACSFERFADAMNKLLS